MSLTNIVGDLYHKHFYRHYSNVMGRVSDTFKFTALEALIAPVVYLPETLIAYYAFNSILSSFNGPGNPTANGSPGGLVMNLLMGLAGAAGLYVTTYGVNHLRTPLTKKLELKEKKIDIEKELNYTIGKLNKLSESPELEQKEYHDLIKENMEKVLEDIYDYKVRVPKRVKTTIFRKVMRKDGWMGMMNPVLTEVISACPDNLQIDIHSSTHERTHITGVCNESEAELLTYIALHKTDNPSLQYQAYFMRLESLISQYGYRKFESYCEKTQLNERTWQEIEDIDKYMKEAEKLGWYGKIRKGIGDTIRYILPKRKKSKKERISARIDKVYISRPLILMSAYDPPTANTVK